MTLSISQAAYRDCEEHFERALASERGIRVWFPGPHGQKDARYYRLRMNNLRKLVRKANQKTYQPDDPNYSTTPWDTLVIRDREPDPADAVDGGWWLYIEPNTANPADVEEL